MASRPNTGPSELAGTCRGEGVTLTALLLLNIAMERRPLCLVPGLASCSSDVVLAMGHGRARMRHRSGLRQATEGRECRVSLSQFACHCTSNKKNK